MKSPFAKKLIWAAVLTLLAGLTQPCWAEGRARQLVVFIPRTGLEDHLSLEGVRGITIKFFHSYDRQWVEESFAFDKGRFAPTSVFFKDDSYDYRHQRYRSREINGPEWLRLTAIDPRESDLLAEIITRVAHTRSQKLVLHGKDGDSTYLFTKWGSPGQRIIFSLQGD